MAPLLLEPFSAVAAAFQRVAAKDDAKDDHKHDGRQSIDLRADLFASHAVNGNGQCLQGAAGKIGDDKVINGIGQADQKRREDGRRQLRQHHLEKGLLGIAAQIQCGLVHTHIHTAQLGGHVEDHIRHTKCDVGDQQRTEAKDVLRQKFQKAGYLRVGIQPMRHVHIHHEQHHQRNTGDDLRVDHRQIAHRVDHPLGALFHTADADGGHHAQNGGHGRRKEGDQQAEPERLQDHLIVQQALIPFQGKAGKQGAAFALVEAEYHHHRDGNIQKRKDQTKIDLLQGGQMLLFHYTTPSISSSSKPLVKLMHSSTITMSTRLSALPRL